MHVKFLEVEFVYLIMNRGKSAIFYIFQWREWLLDMSEKIISCTFQECIALSADLVTRSNNWKYVSCFVRDKQNEKPFGNFITSKSKYTEPVSNRYEGTLQDHHSIIRHLRCPSNVNQTEAPRDKGNGISTEKIT